MIPQVIEVTQNVLCVRRPSYLTCSYLIRRPTGIVLVDAGMSGRAAGALRLRGLLRRRRSPTAHPRDRERMLFAGDAFATIDAELRLMARLVTEDLDAARASMAKCARLDMRWACAGHREPMRVDAEHLRRFRERIEAPDWPLLG